MKLTEEQKKRLTEKFSTTWVKSHDTVIGMNPCYVTGKKCWIVDGDELEKHIESELSLQRTKDAEEFLKIIEEMGKLEMEIFLEDQKITGSAENRGYNKCLKELRTKLSEWKKEDGREETTSSMVRPTPCDIASHPS